MRTAKQAISLLLIVTLISSLIPSTAFATENTEATTTATSPVTVQDTNSTPEIIGEVTEKREANVKHYIKDDYSYEAVVYEDPVHYLEDGEWKEVDNSLKEANDTSVISDEGPVPTQTTTNIVKNQSNDYQVSFAKNANVNKLVQLQKENYELSWSVVDAQNVQHQITTTNEEELHNTVVNEVTDTINEDQEFSKLTKAEKLEVKETLIENEMTKLAENTSSELIYSGILPNVDLKYRVSSGKLKEDIILNQYNKDFNITFQMDTKGLAARLEEDNTISFYDKEDPKKIIFTTAAPFMFDQKGVYSEAVKLTLEESEQGYNMTLTPEDAWLADSNRSYPVVIDPVVNADSDSASIKDTYTSSLYPTTSYYNSIKLGVGKRTTTDTNISFIKFDLPTLSPSSMVTDATLSLSSTSVLNGGTQVNIHKMTSDWNP